MIVGCGLSDKEPSLPLACKQPVQYIRVQSEIETVEGKDCDSYGRVLDLRRFSMHHTSTAENRAELSLT